MPRTRWVGLLAVAAVAGALVVHFQNRSWIAADEGHYAHVAERLADGEVLNRDVEEFHTGAVHFVNLLAFRVFGRDLVSLRYPVSAITFLQSLLMFLIVFPRGLGVALVSGTAMAALGFLEISNPTPSLYVVFGVVLLIGWITTYRGPEKLRILVAGLLAMIVFLFRQISGVFVGMGVVTFLLWEGSSREDSSPGTLARVLIGFEFVALCAYLVTSTDIVGFLLYGAWPLALLVAAWRGTRIANRTFLNMALPFGVGMLVGMSPLLLYHLAHGSVGPWLRDVVVRAPTLSRLGYLEIPWLRFFTVGGAYNLFFGDSPAARINGLYWAFLPILGGLNGFFLLRQLSRDKGRLQKSLGLPFLSAFHALVTLFHQIPFYVYLSVGLSVSSLLWMRAAGRRAWIWGLAATLLAGVGVIYHAGQPSTRTPNEVLQGNRRSLVSSRLPRCSLWIDPGEDSLYVAAIRTIRENTGERDAIFVLPNDAELYFLAERRNPARLFNPAISLLSEKEVVDFVRGLYPRPELIVHDRESKYNTEMTAVLLGYLKTECTLFNKVGRFDFYRRNGPSPPD